jgi:hypothetical protein
MIRTKRVGRWVVARRRRRVKENSWEEEGSGEAVEVTLKARTELINEVLLLEVIIVRS